MEATIKTAVQTLKNNPIGVILGAGAGFLAGKKIIKTEKKWQLILSAVIGGVLGANLQANYKAKHSVPTVSTVKK